MLSLTIQEISELLEFFKGPMFAWPSADLPDEMQFRIQIAFGEPDVVKGKAVVPTLENMVRIVLEIIEDFEAKGLL